MTTRSARLAAAATLWLAALATGCHRNRVSPPVTLAADTVRLGSVMEGDLRLARSVASCYAANVDWTWTLAEIRLAGVGRILRTGDCPPRHFRATIGSIGPMVRPDEPWVPTHYAVVACRPDAEPWRRVVVLLVPRSRLEERGGAPTLEPASTESYARASGDSARQADRAYCATKRL